MKTIALIFRGILFFWILAANAAVSVTDASGQTLKLVKPALRVVTLVPHATELVAALAPHTLVAVDQASNFPALVNTLPKVGVYPQVNIEAVLAQKPDLVVAWQGKGQKDAITRLRELGVPVYISDPFSVQDVTTDLEKLSLLLGKAPEGHILAERLRRNYQNLRATYRGKPPVSVFVALNAQPLLTVSRQSFLGQMVEECGGINPFATLPGTVPSVNMEAVIAAKPQLILVSGENLQQWQPYKMLPAVRQGQVYSIDQDVFLRPGPRLVEGMAAVCRMIDKARGIKMP